MMAALQEAATVQGWKHILKSSSYLWCSTVFLGAYGEGFVMVVLGEGWYLVCVDGYGLGWGKLQKGRLKNKYRAAWKWE